MAGLRGWARAGSALLALAFAACELPEVAAPDSADVLVVEAVLRAGAGQQYILLHRSIQGEVVDGEPGASVAVVSGQGLRVEYREAQIDNCLLPHADTSAVAEVDLRATCYVSPRDAWYFVQPGEEYTLEIETARGEIARGRTRLPEEFRFLSPSITLNPVTLELGCTLPDTSFALTWTQSDNAWSYVITMQLEGWSSVLPLPDADVPDPLELTSVSVSAADTTLQFPANVGLFQRGDVDRRIFELLEEGIPSGVHTTLVVMAAERNYTNAIRGGRFNPSGNVRQSSVVGDAVGVFGGVVPLVILSLPVAGEWPPPCQMPGAP